MDVWHLEGLLRKEGKQVDNGEQRKKVVILKTA